MKYDIRLHIEYSDGMKGQKLFKNKTLNSPSIVVFFPDTGKTIKKLSIAVAKPEDWDQ